MPRKRIGRPLVSEYGPSTERHFIRLTPEESAFTREHAINLASLVRAQLKIIQEAMNGKQDEAA